MNWDASRDSCDTSPNFSNMAAPRSQDETEAANMLSECYEWTEEASCQCFDNKRRPGPVPQLVSRNLFPHIHL